MMRARALFGHGAFAGARRSRVSITWCWFWTAATGGRQSRAGVGPYGRSWAT